MQLYGVRRRETTPPVVQQASGRRFTPAELAASKAAVPRFQRVQDTSAARDKSIRSTTTTSLATGLHPCRQIVTPVVGLERDEKTEQDSNRVLPWLGGILTLQSQSHTGGFQKQRDVVSTTYYERVMAEKAIGSEEAYHRGEERRRRSQIVLKEEEDGEQ